MSTRTTTYLFGATLLLGMLALPASAAVAHGVAADPDPTPARVVFRGPVTARVIAITIDDGYDPATCARMADTLRDAGVPATFFPIGKNVRAAPLLWAAIARDFPLANHTMYHGILPPLPADRVERQVLRGARAISRVTGVRAVPYLRPPGGRYDERVGSIAGRLGVTTLVLWDTTAADTALHSRPSGMLRSALRGGPGSILLMHCNRPLSGDLLPRIIAGYRERGFGFVTIAELLEAPQEARCSGLPAGCRPS